MESNMFYLSQEQKLIKGMDKFLRPIKPELVSKFGEEGANEIRVQALKEFEKLIPQFPYIGGKDNNLTSNLIKASWGLALYLVLDGYGYDVEEVGELIHLSLERQLKKMPLFIRRLMGKTIFSKRNLIKMKKRAEDSQQKKYPGDWVWEIFEGDGKAYDVGIDYTECGIVKFMRSQNADELIPYLCNLDYVLFEALGLELHRTKNLAWGCDCCNFRIKKNGTPPKAWPPKFVERSCGIEEDI
jgi:hypothetical protein